MSHQRYHLLNPPHSRNLSWRLTIALFSTEIATYNMEMDLSPDRVTLLSALLSLSSCTIFYSMNTTLNYITVPIMHIGRPRSESSKQGLFIISSDEKPVSSVSHVLRQWQEIYWRGHRVGPASATFSGATAFYAAYNSRHTSTQQKLYIAAGCWALAAWPFTTFAMVPTNDELHRRADLVTKGMQKTTNVVKVSDDDDSMALLEKWTHLSKIRAALAMVAAGCVMAALVSS